MSSERSHAAIESSGLGKRYLTYEKPHHRLLQGLLRRPMHKEFWALRNVDLRVARGEALGIIGRNGSGKSTLLQVLCGILPPTEGVVHISGRVAALLELGAGFNPEFTGRENVYIKGSLLGMSRARISAQMDRILKFAEIGDFIDQPVKTYSSGMFVRLAFAVVANCDPDILVIDEALSVGDIYFQAKCQKRIIELRDEGCTLLFVTHSVDALAKMCDRVIVLDSGQIVYDGEVRSAVAEYLRRIFGSHERVQNPSHSDSSAHVSVEISTNIAKLDCDEDAHAWLMSQREDQFSNRLGYHRGEIRVGTGGAWVEDFVFAGEIGKQPVFEPFERAELLLRYCLSRPLDRMVFGLQIRSADNVLVYSTNSFYQTGEMHSFSTNCVIAKFSFEITLLPGLYYLSVGVSRFDEQGIEIEALDRRMDAIVLTVVGKSGHALGVADLNASIELHGM